MAVDVLRAPLRARLARRSPTPGGVAAASGLALALATVTWLALAAAARPSILSPPTLRAHAPWLLGPLHGLLGATPTAIPHLQIDLAAGLAILGAAWLLAWATAAALPLRAVLAAVGAAQAILVLGPPQPLTDTFNYVVYGRMALHGANPYAKLPVDGRHDLAFALSNWHHFPSPYGPLFTIISIPLGLLPAPAALWVWKAVVLGCALGVLVLTATLARRLGRSPQRAVACVGLCPVTLVYGVGGLHNDGPSLVCLLAAVVLLVRTRPTARADAAAGALAVAAAGLKPSFAVIVPLVVLGARDRAAATAGAAAAGAATLALVIAVFDSALPAVGLQGRLVTPLSIPNVLGALTAHHGADPAVRAAGQRVLVLVVAAACVAVALRRRLAPAAIGIVLLAALLTVAWVMPWYLAWSLPFAALAGRRAQRVVLPAAAVLCAWLALGAAPQLPSVLHAFGYYPTRTTTGLINHDLETELVR